MIQRRFVRHVEYRCKLSPHTIVMIDIIDRLEKTDVKALRKLIRNEDVFDEFFDLRATSSRRGYSIAPRTRPRTVKMKSQFSWRMVTKINEQQSL